MGCGQGHPGTKYDYGAMCAVCWLLQHFLQQTSTIALWAIQILGGNEVETSPLILSRQNNQARAQTRSIWHHILEQCLCKISLMHYLSKTIKPGLKLGTGSPQGPAGTGSEGRLHMMTRATVSATDVIIQLFTLRYPNIPNNNPRRRSNCEQDPRSANQHQFCEKLEMVARTLRHQFSL